MKVYPDRVLSQKRPGTTLREVKGKYYLYTATLKYVKGKRYPVTIQKYIGKITKNGLIEPDKISFIPTKDCLALLKAVVPLDNFNDADLALIESLPVLIIDRAIYTGRIFSLVQTARANGFRTIYSLCYI